MWEYLEKSLVVKDKGSYVWVKVVDLANELAQDGWELCTCDKFSAYFKRQVNE